MIEKIKTFLENQKKKREDWEAKAPERRLKAVKRAEFEATIAELKARKRKADNTARPKHDTNSLPMWSGGSLLGDDEYDRRKKGRRPDYFG